MKDNCKGQGSPFSLQYKLKEIYLAAIIVFLIKIMSITMTTNPPIAAATIIIIKLFDYGVSI